MLHLVSLRLHASQAAAESDEQFADSDSPQLSRVSDVSYRVDIKLLKLPSDPGHPCNTFQVGPSAHIVRRSGCCTKAM